MDEMMTLSRRKLLSQCTALALVAAAAVAAPARAQGASTASPTAQERPVILIVGDSLSAEYGLRRGTGWVRLLEQRLTREKIAARVVNASISGDTTSGGRSRLPALLAQHRPTHVVLELGGNDALRGLPLSMTQANLAHMVQASKATGAQAVLVGMQIPPNYGRQFSEDFAKVFSTVAQQEKTPLVPFLLKGVADGDDPAALFQKDRIHPREEAQPAMLDNVWPVLTPLLR